jgi:tetratricopeptide (TPR) repeat protein
MTDRHIVSLQIFNMKQWRSPNFTRTLAAIAGSTAIAFNLLTFSALSADPFRPNHPHAIGDRTEAAFRAIFERGNYVEAAEILQTAEPDEPLAHAMKASLAYLEEDWAGMSASADATLSTAQQLLATDPLRGHLYIAVGQFLQGAHIASTQGIVSSTPTLLSKLQDVFNSLREAEQIAPEDPELNLLRGYMDLMLAVNLPFADPNQAIERLRAYGYPSYLVHRGVAIAYRDLDEETQALEAVNQAIAETPDNPDLYYLRAQIYVRQGNYESSLPDFQTALNSRAQFPERLATQLAYENCRAQVNLRRERARTCSAILADNP